MTTVVCVWVKANVAYGVEYVTRLQAMVEKHLDRPHRFVCLTDQPWELPVTIEAVPMASPAPLPGWWAKVRLFDPDLGLTGRVLYLDLDTLVVNDLEPILNYGAPFALVPHTGTFEGRNGLKVVKRFNSSVMVWNAGQQADIWLRYDKSIPSRLWGDQDWISELRPDAAVMPLGWFPRLSEIGSGGKIPEHARVILAKKPKTAAAAKQWPWVDALWRAA